MFFMSSTITIIVIVTTIGSIKAYLRILTINTIVAVDDRNPGIWTIVHVYKPFWLWMTWIMANIGIYILTNRWWVILW
jgi:hypothetical protein